MSRGWNRQRRKLKAMQARLARMMRQLLLLKLLSGISFNIDILTETEEYCTPLAIELKKELINHYRRRAEYSLLLVDLYSRQLLKPDPDIPSYHSIQSEYSALETRANIFCMKIEEGLALKNAEFEKVRELTWLRRDELRGRRKRDLVRIKIEMRKAIAKAKKIKRELNSLKVEWNAVKDELNSGIDGCIQRVILYLQGLIAQGARTG